MSLPNLVTIEWVALSFMVGLRAGYMKGPEVTAGDPWMWVASSFLLAFAYECALVALAGVLYSGLKGGAA